MFNFILLFPQELVCQFPAFSLLCYVDTWQLDHWPEVVCPIGAAGPERLVVWQQNLSFL